MVWWTVSSHQHPFSLWLHKPSKIRSPVSKSKLTGVELDSASFASTMSATIRPSECLEPWSLRDLRDVSKSKPQRYRCTEGLKQQNTTMHVNNPFLNHLKSLLLEIALVESTHWYQNSNNLRGASYLGTSGTSGRRLTSILDGPRVESVWVIVKHERWFS